MQLPDPYTPPTDSRDPLLWSLARLLLDAHAKAVDGLCCLCRPAELHPCPPRRLAAAAMRTACGIPAGNTAAWLDQVRHRLTAGTLDPTDAAAEAIRLARQARRTAVIRRCTVPRRVRRAGPWPGSQ
jgi:hypothetical protein